LEFGVPLILDCANANVDLPTFGDAFEAIGYAQAEDRLFQLFLRLSTANCRLSEFVGAGHSDVNIEADKACWRQMMSADELMAQFTSVMDEDTQLMYTSFAKGLQQRVEEVNLSTLSPAASSSLLPYEFSIYDLDSVPANLFTLESILQVWLIPWPIPPPLFDKLLCFLRLKLPATSLQFLLSFSIPCTR
jgi:hypothetical protein